MEIFKSALKKRSAIILGIGTDIVEISRIKKLVEQYSQTFLDRIFTKREQERAQSTAFPAASYAKRFAAKEAFVKALGLGLTEGMSWTEIEVVNTVSGQPTLEIHGKAADIIKKLSSKEQQLNVHVSLSDTKDTAHAFVIVEVISND